MLCRVAALKCPPPPRTSSIVQIIFSFWSFEISVCILRNQKFIIGLDSFLINFYIHVIGSVWIILVILLKVAKLQYFSLAPFFQTLGLSSSNRVKAHSFYSLMCSLLFKDLIFIFICYYRSCCCVVWQP